MKIVLCYFIYFVPSRMNMQKKKQKVIRKTVKSIWWAVFAGELGPVLLCFSSEFSVRESYCIFLNQTILATCHLCVAFSTYVSYCVV